MSEHSFALKPKQPWMQFIFLPFLRKLQNKMKYISKDSIFVCVCVLIEDNILNVSILILIVLILCEMLHFFKSVTT